MTTTRRKVLVGALVAGGLAVGYVLRPRRYGLPMPARADEVAFDAWLRIDRQGVVTVAVPQCEMGQGVMTVLAQVAATELGADWRQVAVEPAPPAPQYANLALAADWARLWMPLLPGLADAPDDWITRRWAMDGRFDATARGLSLAAYEAPLRAAAASARMLLVAEAAARWNVAEKDCEVQGGLVMSGGRALPFGELADGAAGRSPPTVPDLRAQPAAEAPDSLPPGTPLAFPRLDLPAKADGSWRFAGDVRLPAMLHAAIRHAPMADARLKAADPARARDVAGFVRLVKGPDWVAAVAETWWAAERALDRVAPVFTLTSPADSDDIAAALDHAMHYGKAHRLVEEGAVDVVRGGMPIQIRYETSPALHATIETTSATARFAAGKLELWIATQAPEAARRAAADALGLDAGAVIVYPMPAGGSFDRRLDCPEALEAALIAREAGRPVQLTWSRREENKAALPRGPVAAVMGARLGLEGGIEGWRARIAAPATMREFGRRLFAGATPAKARRSAAGESDPDAVSGARTTYAFPALAVDHVGVDLPLPSAPMRGGSDACTAFFTESFLDELAARSGREPLSWRMALLGQDPRLAECLQRAAALAQWDGGRDASGQGLACHTLLRGGATGRIACIASARRGENGVRVERLSAVADIGRIVNLDIARQQIEGGLVFGMGLALGSSTGYERGEPLVADLAGLGLPALADCPEISVDFVAGDGEPFDPGELGAVVAAPAIANALSSATGIRLRRLPLFADEV